MLCRTRRIESKAAIRNLQPLIDHSTDVLTMAIQFFLDSQLRTRLSDSPWEAMWDFFQLSLGSSFSRTYLVEQVVQDFLTPFKHKWIDSCSIVNSHKTVLSTTTILVNQDYYSTQRKKSSTATVEASATIL